VSLTPDLRGGDRTFVFDFGEQAISTSNPSSGLGTVGIDRSLALAAGLEAIHALNGVLDRANGDQAGGFADVRIGQFAGGVELIAFMGSEETSLEARHVHISSDVLTALKGLQARVEQAGKKLAEDLNEASQMGGAGDLLGFGTKAANALGAALKQLGAEAQSLMSRFPGLFPGNNDVAAPAVPDAAEGDAEAAVQGADDATAQGADDAPTAPERQALDDAGLVRALGLATVFASGLHLAMHRKEDTEDDQRRLPPAG
jgi:hypothetical protein